MTKTKTTIEKRGTDFHWEVKLPHKTVFGVEGSRRMAEQAATDAARRQNKPSAFFVKGTCNRQFPVEES